MNIENNGIIYYFIRLKQNGINVILILQGASVVNVNVINKNQIKINLTKEEIVKLFGGYEMIDYNNPNCKFKIDMLLYDAISKEEFPLDCDRLLIEVKPSNTGCSIYFTRIYQKGKKYKRVTVSKKYILTFSDSDSLISGSCELYKQYIPQIKDSRLYKGSDKYYLVIYAEKSLSENLNHIKEYCSNISKNEILAEKIAEHAVSICECNTIEKIGKAFVKVN